MRRALNSGVYLALTARAIALCFVCLNFSGCEKKTEDETKAASSLIPTAGTGAGQGLVIPHLVDKAEQFGFLSRLPADTQFYFATHNVRSHLERLGRSAFYAELSAYLDDKTPAPTGADSIPSRTWLSPLLKDDSFIALGAGSPQALEVLQRAALWQQRQTTRRVVQALLESFGTPAGKATSSSEELTEASALAVEVAELPIPQIWLGLREENDTKEALSRLITPGIKKLLEALGPASAVTLPDGSTFSLHRGKLGSLLGGDLTDLIEPTLLAKLKEKPLSVALGTVGEYVIISLSGDLPVVQFPDKPAESLMGRKDWDALLPYADKPLLCVGWADVLLQDALKRKTWLAPVIRALLGRAPANSPLQNLGKELEPQIAALEASETRVLDVPSADGVMACWWNQGLHAEVFGGSAARPNLPTDAQLTLSHLLDSSDVVYASNGLTTLAERQRLQDHLQVWAALVRDMSYSLLKKGVKGTAESDRLRVWLEQEIIPPLMDLYASGLRLMEESLGPETATLLTLKHSAATSTSPGALAPPPAELPSLRWSHVWTIRDSRALSASWMEMGPTLDTLQRSLPSGATLFSPNPVRAGQTAIYRINLPLPVMTSLSPALSVGEHRLCFSTSADYAEEMAKEIEKQSPALSPATEQWMLNIPLIRSVISDDSLPIPSESALQALPRWLAPLGVLRGESSVSGGRLHRSWSWSIHDVEKYD